MMCDGMWRKTTPLPLFDLFLEARAEIQKYLCSFFGSNENFKICFRDLLTFSTPLKAESLFSYLSSDIKLY